MNEYDSEKVFQLLATKYSAVQDAAQADVVFVNTCAVREKAEAKLYGLFGKFRELRRQNPDVIIGIGGCVAQQEGEKLLKRCREIDFVVGTHNLSLIPSLIEDARVSGGRRQVAVDYRDEWEELPEEFDSFPQIPGVQEGGKTSSFGAYYSPVRAMVAIQRGCNKRCSFCVVPTTRGPEVSRDPAEIEREVRLKVRMGAREVLLLGQTVNSYGLDLAPRFPFANLIRSLAKIPNLLRIRFTSPHPAEVRPDFIELYGEVPTLCPHIHLPLQSGSDRVLKLMNRNYRTKRYLEIVESLREKVPEIAISSDFIIGFPTESDADFEQTLNLIEQVRYCSSYCFKYSPRPNTQALDAFNDQDQVPKSVVEERFNRLQALQERISLERNSSLVTKEVEVLVEGWSSNISSLLKGRTQANTIVELRGLGSDAVAFKQALGTVVTGVVEYASSYGLRARIVDSDL